MKIVIILILSTLLGVSVVLNTEQYKQNVVIENQLTTLRKSYIKHLNKCSFISWDMIQKINGRHIVLYHPQNTNHN